MVGAPPEPMSDVLQKALNALQEAFPVGTPAQQGRPPLPPEDHMLRRARRQLRRTQLALRKIRLKSRQGDYTRVTRDVRIGAIWKVRAGLSNPQHSLHATAQQLLELCEDEQHVLSHCSVSQCRDAFAEVI